MPATAPSVTTTFWVGMTFVIVVSLFFYLTNTPEDGGPTRWARLQAAFIMWSARQSAARTASMKPVYIPVLDTDMGEGGMAYADGAAPDIDAVNADMPRFDRDITAGEWIVRMACARDENKKYRFSANQIHAAVGGDRNTVLARIKELRAGPPPAAFRQPDGSTAPASRPITS